MVGFFKKGNRFLLPLALSVLAIIIIGNYKMAFGQEAVDLDNSWVFKTRLVLSGNSDESTPSGFDTYSGVGIEASITRHVWRNLYAEASIRTESREVDQKLTPDPDARLGSIEMMPLTLTILYRKEGAGRFHPYAGLGANLTIAWEKSGVLDSLDIAPHFGPAIQFGLDYDLSKAASLNFNLGWNTLSSDIELAGEQFAKLKIDPIALGLGIGFKF